MTARQPIDAWIADLRADEAFSPSGMLARSLTEDERRRGACYRAELSARRFMHSRMVVRALLAERLGEPPAALRIAATPAGKPVLVDHPRVHVSWARSGDLLLVAVGGVQPIGVDIELLRVVPSAAQVLTAVRPGLVGADAELDPLRFFSAWTLLEAAVKATGRGLAAGARDVSLTMPQRGPCTLRAIAGAGAARWHGRVDLVTSRGDETAMAAFVARGTPVCVRLRRWSRDLAPGPPYIGAAAVEDPSPCEEQR